MREHSVLITGASRGIGLSLVRHYKKQGAAVFAVCRNASPELTALDVNVIDQIDVSGSNGIAVLVEKIGTTKIDVLINNAGILQNEALGSIEYDSVESQFRTNALGPLRVTEALLPNLPSGSKVVMITSRMGSIADNTSGGRYGYRMSKAALNIAAVSLARDLEVQNIAVGIVHPGLVGTDMIQGQGNMTPDEAAVLIGARIEALCLDTTGYFWHSNGETLPW